MARNIETRGPETETVMLVLQQTETKTRILFRQMLNAHSAFGSVYCCIHSSCCIVSIRCPIAAFTAEARLLHLRHVVIALPGLQHSKLYCCVCVNCCVCSIGYAGLDYCVCSMRSDVLILQHPRPPIDSCCICNIIVRRVMVWGYRLLI